MVSADVLIVGGGFFGLYLAEHLRSRFDKIVICEKHSDFMQRASYANQARVHNGYHYPRSILTAFRSRVNSPRFVKEFASCIDRSFQKIYAVGRHASKVTGEQFRLFVERIGAPIKAAPDSVKALFDPHNIEEVLLAEEYAFDAVALKKSMVARVLSRGVALRSNTKVVKLSPQACGQIDVFVDGPNGKMKIRTGMVFNCAYSQINQAINASGIPGIPLKHELTELCLVEVPDDLCHKGITVMCGPYFSCMPFPPLNLHTLSHVRYTPHFHWYDGDNQYRDAHQILASTPKTTAFPHMIRDAQRYLPVMARCVYRGSLWEVKTVLPRSEVDDGRPILFKPHYGMPNHHVVMGGKIDNVYDAVEEIDKLLSEHRIVSSLVQNVTSNGM